MVAPVLAGVDEHGLAQQTGIHAFAQSRNGASSVGTQDDGEFKAGVLALLNPDVAVIKGGGVELHLHLAGGGLGCGHFLQGEGLADAG